MAAQTRVSQAVDVLTSIAAARSGAPAATVATGSTADADAAYAAQLARAQGELAAARQALAAKEREASDWRRQQQAAAEELDQAKADLEVGSHCAARPPARPPQLPPPHQIWGQGCSSGRLPHPFGLACA